MNHPVPKMCIAIWRPDTTLMRMDDTNASSTWASWARQADIPTTKSGTNRYGEAYYNSAPSRQSHAWTCSHSYKMTSLQAVEQAVRKVNGTWSSLRWLAKKWKTSQSYTYKKDASRRDTAPNSRILMQSAIVTPSEPCTRIPKQICCLLASAAQPPTSVPFILFDTTSHTSSLVKEALKPKFLRYVDR